MPCYTAGMALGSQLPIRLDPETDLRLQQIAQATGTSKSALIRLLATTFVNEFVSGDGTVTLPPNWNALLNTLPRSDGRSIPEDAVALVAEEATSAVADGPVFRAKKKVSYLDDHKRTRPAPRDKRSDTMKKS